ncbi:MAG TPA: hypothetical protein VEW94_10620 [Chloroflexia bacterium]|nr:hypothetical protein [Chloroflexia bacterium]
MTLVLPTPPQAGVAPPSSPPPAGSFPGAPPQYAPNQNPTGQYAPPQVQYPQQQYPPNQYPQVQYSPPPGPPGTQYQYPVVQVQAKRSNPCGCCLVVLLVVLVLVVGTGVGGFFLVQNGTITQRGILNTLGMGTGEAAVLNLSDADLSVSISSLSSDSDSSLLDTSLTLKPSDSGSFTSIQPGRYRISFSGSGPSGDCTLQISSGDLYQFVAVNDGVVITNEKYPPSSNTDLNMATAPLCKK